jgi:hypothetical protein
MEAVSRTAEGHQIAVKLVRLRPDGTPSIEETLGKHAIGGSPSMPAEALFGTVHLGEKFASQLIVSNEGAIELYEVRIKVELQTSSLRAVLCEPDDVTNLAIGQNVTLQTMHDIREVGVHIIVCSVHYMNVVTNERKFVRKFFKFTVINPLALKTKVTELAGRDLVLLEAQIQNVSTTIFILETVRFEPMAPLMATTIDSLECDSKVMECLIDGMTISPSGKGHTAEYRERELIPNAMFQFVFLLVHPSVLGNLPLQVGKLDITWRSEGGERGRLQTGALTHSDGQKEALCMTVCDIPSHTYLHEPFEALFLFQNGTERDLSSVQLIFDFGKEREADVIPLGCTRIHLGDLTALNTTRHRMMLMPLRIGLIQPQHFWVEYEDVGVRHRRPLKFTFFIETRVKWNQPPNAINGESTCK